MSATLPKKVIEHIYVMHVHVIDTAWAHYRIVYTDGSEKLGHDTPSVIHKMFPQQNPKVTYLTTLRQAKGKK